MKRAQIGRRELLQRGAVVAAIAAVGLPMAPEPPRLPKPTTNCSAYGEST
jgi:hypothetical protein